MQYTPPLIALLEVLIAEGFTSNLSGSPKTGFFHGNIFLPDTVSAEYTVMNESYTGLIFVNAVTSSCGVKGIAMRNQREL